MQILPEPMLISFIVLQYLTSITASVTATTSVPTSSSRGRRCEKIYTPVCGTDAKTYSNACVLNRISRIHLQHGLPPIHVKIKGECPLKNCMCTENVQPVCATNGETYSNICRYNCERNYRINLGLSPINIAHNGPCEEQACICIGIIIPVCGTDSMTYRNVCILECINRINDSEGLQPIGVHYKGACHTERCMCPRNYQPLCASDDRTYPNNCTLRCENRRRHQLGKESLTALYEGECKNCFCPAIHAPVCGSDGITYPNSCTLDCKNRKRENLAPITVVSEGECPCICTAQYEPVCGTDGKTYSNICRLGCENQKRRSLGVAELEVDYKGECYLSCKHCSHYYAPVCGSDGRTYLNKCWLHCNIDFYNAQKLLSLAAYGPC